MNHINHPFMDTRFCAGAFIVKENQFLFGKRTDTRSWYASVWDIFGGHALPGEGPFDTLKRELMEELDIVPTSYELVVVADIFDEALTATMKYYIYFVTEWSGMPVNQSEEHSEVKWFYRHELDAIQLASKKYLTAVDTWLKEKESNKG